MSTHNTDTRNVGNGSRDHQPPSRAGSALRPVRYLAWGILIVVTLGFGASELWHQINPEPLPATAEVLQSSIKSDFALVDHTGKPARQGDVIGYVGATGLATGPNLHYEVLQGRRQVDPMKVKLPPRRLLGKVEMPRFEREKEKIRSLLAFQPRDELSRQAALTGPEVRDRLALKSNEQKEA